MDARTDVTEVTLQINLVKPLTYGDGDALGRSKEKARTGGEVRAFDAIVAAGLGSGDDQSGLGKGRIGDRDEQGERGEEAVQFGHLWVSEKTGVRLGL